MITKNTNIEEDNIIEENTEFSQEELYNYLLDYMDEDAAAEVSKYAEKMAKLKGQQIENSNIDISKLVDALSGTMSEAYIKDIIMRANKYASEQDHGESPFTRPTFSKIVLLSSLIIFVIIWLIFPIATLVGTSIGDIKSQKIDAKVEERKIPLGSKFAYKMEIIELLDGQKVVNLYDSKGRELLAKADLVNDKAFLVTEKNGNFEISAADVTALKMASNDLKEDIKEDVYSLIKTNYSPNDTYLEFKNIDFGVDQVINVDN